MKVTKLQIEKVASLTSDWPEGTGSTQIWCDKTTGHMWTKDIPDMKSWTKYGNNNLILVCNTSQRMTPEAVLTELKHSFSSKGIPVEE